MRLTATTGPVSSPIQDTAPVLNLRTGYLDDRRTTLHSGDLQYVVFRDAYRMQDSWTDPEHRRFWEAHLSLWTSSGRSRPNKEALAFTLVAGRADGFSYREVVDEMPGRTWSDLRDRDVLAIADAMYEALEGGPDMASPPWTPTVEQHCDGSISLLGPAHPAVIAAQRLWRLPRVWAETDTGHEEAALPPRLAGRINLPHLLEDELAFGAIGNASLTARQEGQAALNRLRARRQQAA